LAKPFLQIALDEHHEPAHCVSQVVSQPLVRDTRNFVGQPLALAAGSFARHRRPRRHGCALLSIGDGSGGLLADVFVRGVLCTLSALTMDFNPFDG
jgi:hypothetical protein